MYSLACIACYKPVDLFGHFHQVCIPGNERFDQLCYCMSFYKTLTFSQLWPWLFNTTPAQDDHNAGGRAIVEWTALVAAASFATLCYVAYTKFLSGKAAVGRGDVLGVRRVPGRRAGGVLVREPACGGGDGAAPEDAFPCGTSKSTSARDRYGERFAETLVEGRKYGRCLQVDLEDFEPDELIYLRRRRVTLHVGGDPRGGEPADNAIGFHKWLKDPDLDISRPEFLRVWSGQHPVRALQRDGTVRTSSSRSVAPRGLTTTAKATTTALSSKTLRSGGTASGQHW